MRKLSEGKRSPKAPLKSAPTSHNAENPRRIRADSAGVLKYETHQRLRQRTRYVVRHFSPRGEPQRERKTPAQPSRWTRATEQSRQSRGPPSRKQSAMLPG